MKGKLNLASQTSVVNRLYGTAKSGAVYVYLIISHPVKIDCCLSNGIDRTVESS